MTRITSAEESAVARAQRELQEAGVRTVIGTVVNASGLTLAKSVPLARIGTFHQAGMGAAPVWHVFTIDGGIAFTDSITPVGDMRLKIDIAGLRVLQGGRAWAPASLFDQDGAASPVCARGLLAGVDGSLNQAGYQALVGHELEFFLISQDGSALETTPWVPYGATGLLDRSEFLDDLLSAMNQAGIPIEQIHAEYGRNQFEFSLPPASPAYLCWGLENREASVRFLNEGRSNPHGANVEVKIVDPSANVYLASAAILTLALEGIRTGRKLPAEVPGDPGRLSEDERRRANIRVLPNSPGAIIDTLDKSRLARGLLGDAIVDATVAVRRYEQRASADLAPDELAERFRLAWSI